MAKVPNELVNERQKDRFDRDVARRVVEGRRPDDDAPEPDLAFGSGDGTIVVAGEHTGVRCDFQGTVAEDVSRGEVAAVRRLEHFEHGMAVIEKAERRTATRRPIDRLAERSREQTGLGRGPGGAVAGDDEQPATTFDEPLERACTARRKRRVV